MAGRALVVFCLVAGLTAAFCILGSVVSGFSEPATAGVYPQQPVQTSEDPWERYASQANVQRAVWALERLAHESEAARSPAKDQHAQAVPRPRPMPVPAVPAAPRVRHARLVVPKPGSVRRSSRPQIAIVIDDLGLNGRRTERLIDLDGPFTLSFLPYGYNLSLLSRRASSHGHEVFLHLPMEPFGKENPGPNALLENLSKAEFERRMSWAFAQVDGIKGFNNHMGSRLTADPVAMQRVMTAARQRNLLFLDSRTSGRSVAYDTALSYGVPAAARDIFLDHDPSVENIVRQLAKVEKIARHRGHAIAIGHPYDTTYTVLKSWIAEAKDRGFELVPVSVLIEESNAPLVAAAGAPAGSGGTHSSVQRPAQ